jgi:hypothetical protein
VDFVTFVMQPPGGKPHSERNLRSRLVRATNKVRFSTIRFVFPLRANNNAGFNLISFGKPTSDRISSSRAANKVRFSTIHVVFPLRANNSAGSTLFPSASRLPTELHPPAPQIRFVSTLSTSFSRSGPTIVLVSVTT